LSPWARERFIDRFYPRNSDEQRNAVVCFEILTYLAQHGGERALSLIRKLGKMPRI
jgi:hypothetical protein